MVNATEPFGLVQLGAVAFGFQVKVREAKKSNIPFLAALAGALRRCSSLVWFATRRSERLALHPASAPKNGILTISAPLNAGAFGQSFGDFQRQRGFTHLAWPEQGYCREVVKFIDTLWKQAA